MAGQRKRKNVPPPEIRKKPIEVRYEEVTRLTPDEIKSLVQDLRTYQVELDTQIAELKMAQEELRQSRDKYQALYDSAPVGYLTIDSNQAILEANATTAKMLGIPRTLLLKSRFTQYLAPTRRSQDEFYLHCRRIFQTGGYQECDLEMQRKDGSRFMAHLRGTAVSTSIPPDQVRVVISDITERKKAEEVLDKYREELEKTVKERTAQLTESEEKYRALVENASEAVIVLQDNRMRFFNRKTLEMSGYSSQEVTEKSISDFIYPEDRQMVNGQYLRRLQGENVPSSYEFRMQRKDGTVLWVHINSVLVTWEGKPATLALVTDITERKNLEQMLKSYAQKITRVQEEERKRIAYELHDDTAQYLSILKLQLDSLINSGKIQDPAVLEKLRYLEKDAGRAVDDVRRYSHELRPSVLEHLGLRAALEQIAEDINKLDRLQILIEAEGTEPKLSEDVKLGFFRIAQEALNNIRKHARATQATIHLKFQNKQMSMRVIDNGIGFDMKNAQVRSSLKGSLGMISMQERTELIGASLIIESQPGKGTTITVNKLI